MSDTILVTGISGFIAKHVALAALAAGYRVRGTLRNLAKADAVRATLQAHGGDLSRVEFAAADLERDDGWAEAAAGCRFVQHVASPFPLAQPRDREALVPTAREGALRTLRAGLAAGAERIVLTSSLAAVMYKAGRGPNQIVGEEDWSDPDWPPASAYVISKLRAERAAWDFMSAQGAKDRLVTVNPGWVAGPALDGDLSTSHEALAMMLRGQFPAAPPASFPVVDARDVAALHLAGVQAPAAGGRRLLAAAGSLSLLEMADALREGVPEAARKAPTRELPLWLVKLAAPLDARLGAMRADYGARTQVRADYVQALTGVSFRPAREAVMETGRSLVALGLV